MPYEGDPIQDAVDVLWLAVIGAAAYLLYKTYELGANFDLCTSLQNAGADTLANLIGCTANTQVIDKALQNAGGQAGGVGGYDYMDTSGGQWSCTGPPALNCFKVVCDSNNTCTPQGAAVPESQVPGLAQAHNTNTTASATTDSGPMSDLIGSVAV